MALYYQTEYRLGKRGRISRSYTGLQAFLAIFFDLIFGLIFELVTNVVGLALRLVVMLLQLGFVVLRRSWSTLIAVIAAIAYMVTIPFVFLHHALDRLRSRLEADRRNSHPISTVKPDWALGREV
jgi:hypothetical protein